MRRASDNRNVTSQFTRGGLLQGDTNAVLRTIESDEPPARSGPISIDPTPPFPGAPALSRPPFVFAFDPPHAHPVA